MKHIISPTPKFGPEKFHGSIYNTSFNCMPITMGTAGRKDIPQDLEPVALKIGDKSGIGYMNKAMRVIEGDQELANTDVEIMYSSTYARRTGDPEDLLPCHIIFRKEDGGNPETIQVLLEEETLKELTSNFEDSSAILNKQ